MRVLQDRLAQLRADGGGGGSSGGATAAAASAGLDAAADGDELDEAGRSFSSADDDELTFALNQRISQIAATTGDYGSSTDEADMRRPLTGEVRLAGTLLLLWVMWGYHRSWHQDLLTGAACRGAVGRGSGPGISRRLGPASALWRSMQLLPLSCNRML
jgi:hypothetical protein